MKYKQWNYIPNTPAIRAELEHAGVPPLAAAVLCARGFGSVEQVRQFLSADERLLADPMLLRDMDRAVLRVRRALAEGETIAVYGDYDVDGITSTALLTDFLRQEGARVIPYIPDRMAEGYGLNHEAVISLAEQGVSLIITVDCGITISGEAETARNHGVDLVITDHHECKAQLPDAAAVVDPHRPDCLYPFKHLAGVGVALKLVLALGGPERQRHLLAEYADLAAIGTVADVMKVVGENRVIIRMGLASLAHCRRPGLTMLMREAGLEGRELTSSSIGYVLAPRINASGRMGCAGLAAELLLTDDPDRGAALARELCALNRERQSIESDIYQECVLRLMARPPEESHAIVLADASWHQGVVGIVASRLTEKYQCPAFMICLDQGKGKGSCRSYGGVNLFALLESCSDLLEGFGGHELAAGFTILEENIPAFRRRVNGLIAAQTGGDPLPSVLEIDAEIDDLSLLSLDNVDSLSLLEPYGAGMARPVFSLTGVEILSAADVGGGRHLKLRVGKGERVLDAIFFSTTAAEVRATAGDRVDLAFQPQVNEFRGRRDVQLQLTDLRPAKTRAQLEQHLFQRLMAGEGMLPGHAAGLLPSRKEFAGLWRYLQNQTGRTPRLETGVSQLSKSVARAFGLRESYGRTLVCLEVMDELGLIQVERRDRRLTITVNTVEGKVDLEQSALMKRLRKLAN